MKQDVAVMLTAIVGLGICAQWVAWRVRVPSILLLLAMGLLAGPITGFMDPNELLGDLLQPLVSLSVAVILFEGGLSLKVRELRDISGVFLRLTTIGVAMSWLGGMLAAHQFLGFSWSLSALLGAILVVTGPTVIGPILRHLRLGGQVGALLKWEGIVIDPVGAILAVVVFIVARSGISPEATRGVLLDLGQTVLVGLALGGAGALVLAQAMRRFWIPDSLQNAVSLSLVFLVATVANRLGAEAGLLAVTVMGVVLANQKSVPIKHLVEFKENLSVLLISSLFIILSARLRLEDFKELGWGSVLFVGALILVVRPASVLISTMGTKLGWRERAFLCWMAPRGIVAVAVTSVFGLEMERAGYAEAAQMVPVTFLTVFVTVLLYGLSAEPLAKRLGLSRPNPQGVLFLGANAEARSMAQALAGEGCPVLLVDTNWENVRRARMAGLPRYYGSALAEQTLDDIDFSELGRLVALTANNEANSLACLRYAELFGRREVYQLAFEEEGGRHQAVPREQRGRFLFGPKVTYARLDEISDGHPLVKVTRLTKEYNFKKFQEMNGKDVIPLFLLKADGAVVPFTADNPPTPEAGQKLICLHPRGAATTADGTPVAADLASVDNEMRST